MNENRTIRTASDAVIVLCDVILMVLLFTQMRDRKWLPPVFLAALFLLVLAGADLYGLLLRRAGAQVVQEEGFLTGRLILLDEADKPVRSWDMGGRTALVIGKSGGEGPVDVDLADCEYGSLVDFQHAVLNFCLDRWYVEDLDSHNGVRVRKVEDGECYRVMGRPCQVTAGDVLYIANTRLLLS